jgi:Spy/CpxP family protein refolding chaperone
MYLSQITAAISGLLIAALAFGCSPPGHSLNAPTCTQDSVPGSPTTKPRGSDADKTDELIKILNGKSKEAPMREELDEPTDRNPPPAADKPADQPDAKVVLPKAAEREDSKDPKPAPAVDKPASKPEPKVALPKYFDQLSLTAEQKDKISKTNKDYDDKIADKKEKMVAASKVPGGIGMVVAARNAIKKLESQRQEALEGILTNEQRTKLQQLRSDK